MSDITQSILTSTSSRFTYSSDAVGSAQQVVVSIPILRQALERSEAHAKRLADRIERRDKKIEDICRRLPVLSAYVLRVANATAVVTEGHLLGDSSISHSAPNALISVTSDPLAVFEYLESVLAATEDCIINAVKGPTVVNYPEAEPIIHCDPVTVNEILLDATLTIGSRLSDRTIATVMSPALSALTLENH